MKADKIRQTQEEIRCRNYVLLSRLTSDQLTLDDMKKCLEFIEQDSDTNESSFSIADVLREWLSRNNEQEIKVEYGHVFILPAGVKPYESVYLGKAPLLHQEPWIEVKRFYLDCGFKLEEPRMHPEDHLSVEFAFMAHLIEKGEQKEKEREFFLNHIQRWAPKFWKDLKENPYSVFYEQVADYGLAFTEQEIAYFTQ